MRRPAREGRKPYDGHERTGEVGLRRSTNELAEQWKVTSYGGWGGKGAAGGKHRWDTHAPDSEQESACSSVRRCASGKLQSSLPHAMILQKSRMRKRARTDLCGGRFVRTVPTATFEAKKLPRFRLPTTHSEATDTHLRAQ